MKDEIKLSNPHEWLIGLSKKEIDELFDKYEIEVLTMPEDELLYYMYAMEMDLFNQLNLQQ